MKAVMYHYVRPGTDRPPYDYYYLDLDDFRRQLNFFAREYVFVGRDRFESCLDGAAPPDNGILLTFDDGLLDHHEWVLPELESRDLWGLFFVPTAPLVHGVRLSVHRVHTLLGVAPDRELLAGLEEIIDADPELEGNADRFEEVYESRSTPGQAARFKRLVNFAIPYERLDSVLTRLEDRFPTARDVGVDEYYLTPERLRDLEAAGMGIVSHSVNHPVLSRLPPNGQASEISDSIEHLDDLLVHAPMDAFAYPYGGAETYTETTIQRVGRAGCSLGFTTVAGDVTPTEITESPLTLPRRDCNEFPHGQASGG